MIFAPEPKKEIKTLLLSALLSLFEYVMLIPCKFTTYFNGDYRLLFNKNYISFLVKNMQFSTFCEIRRGNI
jgi:hypothetical protein